MGKCTKIKRKQGQVACDMVTFTYFLEIQKKETKKVTVKSTEKPLARSESPLLCYNRICDLCLTFLRRCGKISV